MILTLYLISNGIMLAVFFKYRNKNLHKLEIFTYWLISTLLIQNYSALNTMNFKYFVVPDNLSIELAHFLNRTVLYPVLFVWFLNEYVGLGSFWRKLVYILSFVLVLFGLEWLAFLLGVFQYYHWNIGWSFAIWLATILISIGFMRFFRKRLIREVKHS